MQVPRDFRDHVGGASKDGFVKMCAILAQPPLYHRVMRNAADNDVKWLSNIVHDYSAAFKATALKGSDLLTWAFREARHEARLKTNNVEWYTRVLEDVGLRGNHEHIQRVLKLSPRPVSDIAAISSCMKGAAAGGNIDVMEWLGNEAMQFMGNEAGQLLDVWNVGLLFAARNNKVAAMRTCSEHNATDWGGALKYAALGDAVEAMHYAVSKGATNLNEALKVAVVSANWKATMWLADNGANDWYGARKKVIDSIHDMNSKTIIEEEMEILTAMRNYFDRKVGSQPTGIF